MAIGHQRYILEMLSHLCAESLLDSEREGMLQHISCRPVIQGGGPENRDPSDEKQD